MKSLKNKLDQTRERLMITAVELMPTEEMRQNHHLKRARRAFLCASMVGTAMPLLLAIFGVLLMPLTGMAQTPSGDFFGQNADSLGLMVKAGFILFVLLLFVYGLYSLGMAFVDYRNNQPVGKGLIAGLGCLGFGAVCAAAWAIRNGTTPVVPTNELNF